MRLRRQQYSAKNYIERRKRESLTCQQCRIYGEKKHESSNKKIEQQERNVGNFSKQPFLDCTDQSRLTKEVDKNQEKNPKWGGEGVNPLFLFHFGRFPNDSKEMEDNRRGGR